MDVMKAQTYDAKVTKNINVTGLDKEIVNQAAQTVTGSEE